MKNYKWTVIANLVFGTSLVVLSQIILPVCHSMGQKPMRCQTSATVEAFFAISLLVLAVVDTVYSNLRVQSVLSWIAAAIGIFVSLVPTVLIGTCPHAHMPCHSVTAPTFALAGSIIAVFSILNALYNKRRRPDEKDSI